MTVFIRDERDGSFITDTNVTINAQSYANQTTRITQLGFVNMTILANTDYNVTATSATNYSQRTMIVNVPDEPSATITFYLSPAATTESVVIYAEDDKKAVLPNTLISVWRMVNGLAHLIAQRKTDVTGGALFNLVADVTYQVYADKAGYFANPADYQVKSEPNCGALIFGCFKMTLVPASSVVFQDKSGINFGSNLPPSMDAREGFNLTITVSSSTNTFSEWGYTAYLNDTNISTTTQTTAAGGSYTRKLNLSNRTGVRLVVYVGYITTNNITGERYFETWINAYAPTTQERDNSLVGSFQNTGLSTGAGILLSVLIALVVGIFFQKETNNQNDILLGFILMSVLGICTYLNLMPLLAFIPAAVLIVMGSVVLSANREGL
jgi:hypothetical protein